MNGEKHLKAKNVISFSTLFPNKPGHRVVKELVDAVDGVSSHKGEPAKRPRSRSVCLLQHESNMIKLNIFTIVWVPTRGN